MWYAGCFGLTYALSLGFSLNLSCINLNVTILFAGTTTYIISLQSMAYFFRSFNIITNAPLM